MPRRVKVPEHMQEPEEPEEQEAPAVADTEVHVEIKERPPSPPSSPSPSLELAPKPALNPDADPTPPLVKPKKVMSEKQKAALANAREKAAESRLAKRLLKEGAEAAPIKEGGTLPPVVEKEAPPPPPQAPAKKSKQERDQEKADKVMAQAKARAKKQQAAPIKKPPKQVSIEEKTGKENARRVKEGQAMKKLEFDARVARQVQVEMRRQKAIEKIEEEEREAQSHQGSTPMAAPPLAPQNTVRPNQPAQVAQGGNTPKMFQFMHDGEPAYVRMQKHGDSFMDRMMSQMSTKV